MNAGDAREITEHTATKRLGGLKESPIFHKRFKNENKNLINQAFPSESKYEETAPL